MAKSHRDEYPEIEQILARLKGGKPSEVVCLFIPSHDRRENKLPDGVQKMWADAGLELFGELFEGATAFQHLKGVYQPTGEKPLYDDPL